MTANKSLRNTTKKNSIFNTVGWFIIGLILVGFGYWLGLRKVGVDLWDVSPRAIITRQVPEGKEVNFSLFWKVWDILDDSYFDSSKIVPYKMVYGAISGMVSAIGDPYTVFLSPEDNKVVEEDLQGNFDGVGIQIGYIGSQLAVIAPLPESPAEAAGVKAKDLIIGITDPSQDLKISTAGISIPNAVQAIRGKKGTTVTLTILREGIEEPLEIEITRDTIEVPSIVVDYIQGENSDYQIANVKILKFVDETTQEWEEAVLDILKDPQVKGIILDVRNNPGGYLEKAVEISGDFLDIGDVAVIEEDGKDNKQIHKVTKLGRLKKFEVVILVNEGSASASEILAGALRDNLQTPVVGKTSFGKGTIQESSQVENGAGLHITVAKWLTPNETWVNEVGIKPDFDVENNPDTQEDEQLQKAQQVLTDLINH